MEVELGRRKPQMSAADFGTDAEGQETWTLTPEGVQVARQKAIGDEATINAILDAVEPTFRPR